MPNECYKIVCRLDIGRAVTSPATMFDEGLLIVKHNELTKYQEYAEAKEERFVEALPMLKMIAKKAFMHSQIETVQTDSPERIDHELTSFMQATDEEKALVYNLVGFFLVAESRDEKVSDTGVRFKGREAYLVIGPIYRREHQLLELDLT